MVLVRELENFSLLKEHGPCGLMESLIDRMMVKEERDLMEYIL